MDHAGPRTATHEVWPWAVRGPGPRTMTYGRAVHPTGPRWLQGRRRRQGHNDGGSRPVSYDNRNSSFSTYLQKSDEFRALVHSVELRTSLRSHSLLMSYVACLQLELTSRNHDHLHYTIIKVSVFPIYLQKSVAFGALAHPVERCTSQRSHSFHMSSVACLQLELIRETITICNIR